MFKTATKFLQMGSGLALFPRLECALAFSQIEPVPVVSVLYLTWAGFSCKSCRSETCDCAFATLRSFSIDCSLIQPADTPCFKRFFCPLFTLWHKASSQQFMLKQQVHHYQYLIFLKLGMFSWYKLLFFCFLFFNGEGV